jgi:alkylated DNA nucleotide flippase Atl1
MARSGGLPWWRVVTSTGRLVRGHEGEQARRLRAEGIVVRNGRVVGFISHPEQIPEVKIIWG